MDLTGLVRLFVAALGGLAVGIERQWSGHASGPHARLAGLRTFTLLGALAGVAGWLWQANAQPLAVVLLSSAGALIAIGYARASANDIDATTEVAAVVVLASGVLAGIGQISLAMAIIAIMVLLLVEKSRLHALVGHLDDEGIGAGARFAVMALVVLPILPDGAYGPFGAFRPRTLWAVVLLFSGLSFASYVIRRTVGSEQGYAISGILGGFISSTSVTLTMSRLSQTDAGAHGALASGVMGANAMLFLRVLVAASVLAPAVPRRLLLPFAVPFLAGAALTAWGMRTKRQGPPQPPHGDNPLHFAAAVQMAVLFQAVLVVIAIVQRSLGTMGVFGTAALVGASEVDAMVVAVTRSVATGTSPQIAAVAITIGVLANTLTKLVIALAIGRGNFRAWAASGLALMAVALGAAVFLAARA